MVGKNFFGEVVLQGRCGVVANESMCSEYQKQRGFAARCVFRGHDDVCLHAKAKKMQAEIREIIREMFPDT